jgi:Patatin-like phospholipase
MANDTSIPPGARQFNQILRAEIAAINQRRKSLNREPLALATEGDGRKPINAIGLALSGGGVRSAAFSLGALQALNHHGVLLNVDYLSTVSGGGYIGSSLTATMTMTEGQFAFGAAPTANDDLTASEVSDTAAVGHLRNYSNYLIPTGGRDILTGAAIIIRGLVANLGLVLPVIFLLAAVTILTNPFRTDLNCPDLIGFKLCQLGFFTENFRVTLFLVLIGLALFFLWGLYRSFIPPERASEFRTLLPKLGAAYLVLIGAMFFLELQSFFLAGMFELTDVLEAKHQGSFEWLTGGLTKLAVVITPLAAVVAFFRQQLEDIFKAAYTGAKMSTKIVAVLGRVALWVAGAAVPLLIWIAYLHLSYWGIINDSATQSSAALLRERPAAVETVGQPEIAKSGLDLNNPNLCVEWGTPGEEDINNPAGAHTPKWILTSASWVMYLELCPLFKALSQRWEMATPLFERLLMRPLVVFYCTIGILLLVLSRLLKPNANSLHRLYRDRLSKAFLFDPRDLHRPQPIEKNEPSVDQGRDFGQLDRLLISELSCSFAPYHLINAALNIQGSDYANRRGRNADFFLLSPSYVGSEATGYAPTAAFEHAERSLDVATAMAISGAAASANMGSSSIRPLRPSLALLNIRLGYWLKNPRYVGSDGVTKSKGWTRQRLKDLRMAMTPFLWAEITGRLYENSSYVYLTDGGHIENLGVYELLKRRCKLIIVVDAEADLAMHFPSFVTLQRYARIDLNVLIEMPWGQIQQTTCSWMGCHASKGQSPHPEPSKGPHAAIGKIDYGDGEHGFILYFKSSLTGDENDYIRDYARRYELFPHETTGDQFFSEEQFEVYRALGFHIVHGALCKRDGLQALGSDRLLTLDESENEAVRAVQTALCASQVH